MESVSVYSVILLNLIEALLSEGIFTPGVQLMVRKVSAIATVLVGAFWALNFGYHYFKNSVNGKANPIDWNNLIASFFLMSLLWVYIPVVGGVIQIPFAIDKLVRLNDSDWDQLVDEVYENTMFPLDLSDNDKFVDPDGNVISAKEYKSLSPDERMKYSRDTKTSKLEMAWMFITEPGKIWNSIVGGLTSLLTTSIRVIIQAITIGIIKVMYIFGPFAIVFSFVPLWKDKIGTWFSTLMTTCFVLVTMSVLDNLIYTSMVDTAQLRNEYADSAYNSGIGQLGQNIAYVVMYLLVFWLTGKYVGSDDAGKVMGTTMQTALIATAAATKMKFGGGGGGSGGAAGSVASTAKDPMSKN